MIRMILLWIPLTLAMMCYDPISGVFQRVAFTVLLTATVLFAAGIIGLIVNVIQRGGL